MGLTGPGSPSETHRSCNPPSVRLHEAGGARNAATTRRTTGKGRKRERKRNGRFDKKEITSIWVRKVPHLCKQGCGSGCQRHPIHDLELPKITNRPTSKQDIVHIANKFNSQNPNSTDKPLYGVRRNPEPVLGELHEHYTKVSIVTWRAFMRSSQLTIMYAVE